MNKSRRLTPIHDLAVKKEQDMAQRYAQQLKKVDALRQGGDNLQGFLDNYHSRYSQRGAQGLSLSQLNEYRAFLAKINQAIEEHAVNLRAAEDELALCRHRWDDARRHRDGLAKLLEQAVREEAQRLSKQEQAESDERSARKATHGKTFAD